MGLRQTLISHNNERYPHYYLSHYLPFSAGKDNFSHSLLKFKEARQPDLAGWIDCALEAFGNAPVPAGTTMIRALQHHETTIAAAPTSLDLLGQALAAEFHLQFHPRLLQKREVTRPVKAFSRQRRDAELRDVYFIDQAYAGSIPEKELHSWLILDDILTTGATVRAIIEQIRHHYPRARLSVFTLARAGDDGRPPQRPITLKGQHFQLEQGMDWMRTEEPDAYYSLAALKAWINADSG